jgi:glutamate racemase
VAPAEVTIVDSAESTAQAVARQLGYEESTLGSPGLAPELKFFATDSAEKFRKLGSRFLDRPIENVAHVALKE